MGRRRGKKWNSCLMWFVTSLGALFYTCSCLDVKDPPVIDPKSFDSNYNSPPHHGTTASSCPAKNIKKEDFLVIVSTLDGKLSALDIKNKGELVWSIDADTRPLLSSSISKLEINRDGMRTRLIPSLDGGLYQYDGESIEAIPMTAESLLSATNKVSDRMMMIGGKDIKTYGIDPKNGQLRYACTSSECQFFGDSQVTDDDDIMVITRVTQTVRAVDSRTGSEKWNFSVGSHELEFLPGNDKIPTRYVDDNDDDDDVNIICPSEDTDDTEKLSDFESSLKIIVPEGMVVSLNPEDPNEFRWQHKFSSPVANAWMLKNGVLKSVSVFDQKHIPALSDSGTEENQVPRQPLLYVGLHHNQLYVQPSMKFKENLHRTAAKQGSNIPRIDVPRVTWKPYLHTPSRTPLFRGNIRSTPLLIEGEDKEDQTALTVWHENYPFDNGYYLYPEYSLFPSNETCDGENTDNSSSTIDSVVIVSLFYYWREVVAISVVTSVIVNILFNKLKQKKDLLLSQLSSSDSGDQVVTSPSVGDLSKPVEEYTSRYKTDFDHVQCLGKGGFGIVFEAKNKVDDCHYAVKRISLPNRETAKEKVMREVKALAKLDNIGIVRYFHAWVESPPLGWQEEQDRQIEDSECTGIPTPCNSVTQLGISSGAENKQSSHVLNLENPFGGNGIDGFSFSRNKAAGGSSEFSVNESLNCDDTSSFGILPNDLNQIDEEDHNLNVHFELSDSEDSGSCSKNILPFHNGDYRNVDKSYDRTNNSISIVFEDSGCAEKSEGNSDNSEKDQLNSNDCHIDISNSGQISSMSASSNQKLHSKSDKSTDQSNVISKKAIDQSSASKISSVSPVPKLYLFIQMQLCRRETLKDWLAASNASMPHDIHVVLDIFDQIVSAVDYVHSCGLMHRDLKPSNIFFSNEGIIKVGDFGLVTALTEQEAEINIESNPFKRHTAQVGTQLYMSPEQVSGKSYSHKVDIFSLGVILFELVYPFSTQMERIQTLIRVKERKFPDKFCRDNPFQAKYVEWLLSPDACDRPSTQQILDSELLKDYRSRHTSVRIRHRTTSSSSSGSIGLNHE